MKIVVKDQQGEVRELDALEGWTVMEIVRDHGMPIKAECGGACSCATCHVYVGEKWLDRLHPARDDETEMLDEAFEVEDNSRLSCQIVFSPELDGLEIALAPGTEP